MKSFLLLVSLVVVTSLPLQAQVDSTAAAPGLSAAPADSGVTIERPAARKLLPDNMSFMERSMWGESGVLRGIGIASPLTPEVRKSELQLRRTMLSLHQISGFVTLGFMGTAVFFGQKLINDPSNRSAKNSHQAFVTAAIISYGCTAALSIFSPPPLIRRDESSTTTLHKTLAWVHFAGMIVTPILGSMIGRHADYSQRARTHQVAAYITTGTLALSMIVMTF